MLEIVNAFAPDERDRPGRKSGPGRKGGPGELGPGEILFLIKPGELTLKGGNREGFENILRRNLETMLRSRLPFAKVRVNSGRFYIHCKAGEDTAGGACASPAKKGGVEKSPETAEKTEKIIEEILSRLAGISGWAKARISGKTKEAVLAACVEEGKRLAASGAATFKITARRADKSFPLTSYEICRDAGDAVCAALPRLVVDVHSPEGTINVEIREKAYVYSLGKKGLRGLPVGSAGRGLLLLSGGIDSPVAGITMAIRGMGIDALYFHTPPWTSQEALEKTRRLAETAGSFTMGIRLVTVNFTEVQKHIKERGPLPWTTVLLRMAMMEAASLIARKLRAKCLITGESLSQVASQTVENLTCTESRAGLPVLRPLIGMDKESIIILARQFGTYETSILPYADCCALFTPPHPVLRGDVREANEIYEKLELDGLIGEAVRGAETVKCGYYTAK